VLKQSQQIQGLDNMGATITVTISGNEVAVENARKEAETWLWADKKAHTIIVKAISYMLSMIASLCMMLG